jgi:hypothetical protein
MIAETSSDAARRRSYAVEVAEEPIIRFSRCGLACASRFSQSHARAGA